MTYYSGIARSFINILKHLKTLPLDEVHENIDIFIGVFEEYIQSFDTSVRENNG